MTTREAPPIEQTQVQELPQRLSPYAALLLRSYMEDQGEEDNSQKARLFAYALAGAAAVALRNRNLKNVDTTEIAARYSAIARDAISEWKAKHPDDGPSSPRTEAFIRNASGGLSTAAGSQTTLETLKVLDPEGTLYKKLWLTRGDEKVRMSHRMLHGQTASVGEEFSPGLSYPGDPLAPLSETINCRCFLFAVPASEADQAAKAFEPADYEMAFAASAMTAANAISRGLGRLRGMSWLWQPRDADGRWVDVGDTIYAPEPNGRNKHHRVRVTDVVGRDRVRVQSIDHPDRSWEVDSRDTTADVSKARLPVARSSPARRVRKSVSGFNEQSAGAPIFDGTDLQPGDVVAHRPGGVGTFNYMTVDSVDGDRVTLQSPPEPKFRQAGFEDEVYFQLDENPSQLVVDLSSGNVHEAIDADAVREVASRVESLEYGFANPRRNSSTEVFKNGPSRTDWIPQRKKLHDKLIQDAYDAAEDAEGVPTFYMMGGGPASGKSTMLPAIDMPQGSGAIQVNADDIKEHIPEYLGLMEVNDRGAAQFVHEESSEVSSRMMREAPEGKHIVLDGTGDRSAANVEGKLKVAKDKGMRLVGNYATLPTDMAVQLADKRGKRSGRYVPESFIRGAHSDVTDTFFDLAQRGSFDEVYLWNNEIEGQPRLIFSQKDGVSEIHDEALLIEFLQKSRTQKHSLESVQDLTTHPVESIWEQTELLERTRGDRPWRTPSTLEPRGVSNDAFGGIFGSGNEL